MARSEQASALQERLEAANRAASRWEQEARQHEQALAKATQQGLASAAELQRLNTLAADLQERLRRANEQVASLRRVANGGVRHASPALSPGSGRDQLGYMTGVAWASSAQDVPEVSSADGEELRKTIAKQEQAVARLEVSLEDARRKLVEESARCKRLQEAAGLGQDAVRAQVGAGGRFACGFSTRHSGPNGSVCVGDVRVCVPVCASGG
jgi:chromosome segregation ATPase